MALIADLGHLVGHGLLAEVPHSHPTWADFGPTEWITIVLAGAVGAWAVWKAVMYTLQPGEEEADHIKRAILEDPTPLEVSIAPAGGLRDRRALDGGEDEVARG